MTSYRTAEGWEYASLGHSRRSTPTDPLARAGAANREAAARRRAATTIKPAGYGAKPTTPHRSIAEWRKRLERHQLDLMVMEAQMRRRGIPVRRASKALHYPRPSAARALRGIELR